MKYSLSLLALIGLLGFNMTHATDETADAIEHAVRKSDPAALRGLLIPGFDLSAARKAELLLLAKRVANETFMNLHRPSITDGWRFIKGLGKCALSTGCGLAAYGLFAKSLRLVEPISVTGEAIIMTPPDTSSGGISFSGNTNQDGAMRYLMSKISSPSLGATSSAPVAPQPIITAVVHFQPPSLGEKIANGLAAALTLYLGYLGISDIRASIGGKSRYQQHQKALAVEAIIQRIPACPGPDCPKNYAPQADNFQPSAQSASNFSESTPVQEETE